MTFLLVSLALAYILIKTLSFKVVVLFLTGAVLWTIGTLAVPIVFLGLFFYTR